MMEKVEKKRTFGGYFAFLFKMEFRRTTHIHLFIDKNHTDTALLHETSRKIYTTSHQNKFTTRLIPDCTAKYLAKTSR
jgi:hypothetical protein